jgi:hypothetical protein
MIKSLFSSYRYSNILTIHRSFELNKPNNDKLTDLINKIKLNKSKIVQKEEKVVNSFKKEEEKVETIKNETLPKIEIPKSLDEFSIIDEAINKIKIIPKRAVKGTIQELTKLEPISSNEKTKSEHGNELKSLIDTMKNTQRRTRATQITKKKDLKSKINLIVQKRGEIESLLYDFNNKNDKKLNEIESNEELNELNDPFLNEILNEIKDNININTKINNMNNQIGHFNIKKIQNTKITDRIKYSERNIDRNFNGPPNETFQYLKGGQPLGIFDKDDICKHFFNFHFLFFLNFKQTFFLVKSDETVEDSPLWSNYYNSLLEDVFDTNLPSNGFDEAVQLTNAGKLWKFPIDNEQDADKNEVNIPFYKHIFLDDHLKDFPKEKQVQEFMEYALNGISLNSHLSIKEKNDIIQWYKDYFNEKIDLIRDAIKEEELEATYALQQNKNDNNNNNNNNLKK